MSARSVTLLDGATGTELRARGVNVRDYKSSLWSALACEEAPAAVIRLHRDYIEAGADIITVNNYAITPALLEREGRADDFASLTRRAVDCALAAREQAGGPVAIAGSLPPLNTTFAASLVGDFDDNVAAYRRMAEVLDPHVDRYLCETLTTAAEARAAALVAAETGKPFMVSWTIDRRGERLRGGEDLRTAVAAVADLGPEALLVNCCSCNAVSAALPRLRAATSLPIGAYANPVREEPAGGEPQVVPIDPIGPEDYAEIARGWIAAGATVLGGCCDTNPAFIAALRRLAGPS